MIQSGQLERACPIVPGPCQQGATRALESDGTYIVHGHSDDDPGPGPLGFSPDDLRTTFAEGWRINDIRATEFANNEMPVHKSSA